MIDRQQIKRDAKAIVTTKGIFAVRCSASGEAWVCGSRNLTSSQTGLWFMLRNGMHHSKRMQAAWTLHGADTFQFEILETLDDDVPALLLMDSLRDRRKHLQKELGALAL
jgi:hypothetical protein